MNDTTEVKLMPKARLALSNLATNSDVPAGDDTQMEFIHDLKNILASKEYRKTFTRERNGEVFTDTEALDSEISESVLMGKHEIGKCLELMNKTTMKGGDSEWYIPSKKALLEAKAALAVSLKR